MPIEYAIKADRNLLKAAKKLFGNAVSKAYIACSYNKEYQSREEIRETLKRLKYNDEAKDRLDFDGRSIILIINGKPIELNSSEWGSVYEFNFNEAVEF